MAKSHEKILGILASNFRATLPMSSFTSGTATSPFSTQRITRLFSNDTEDLVA